MKLPEDTLNKIMAIINNTNGMYIGTELQLILEERINKILPSGWRYRFYFDMSGFTLHEIDYDGSKIYGF